MTDGEHLWALFCSNLADDQYDTAYRLLEREATEQKSPSLLPLWMAHFHALYGQTAVHELGKQLEQARRDLRQHPLFLALEAEYQAQLRLASEQTAQPAQPKPMLPIPNFDGTAQAATLTGLDAQMAALTRYHWFCTLFLRGEYEQALKLSIDHDSLPQHLRWRLRSVQAEANEQLGHSETAAGLYGEAAALAQGIHKAFMWQEQAALLLHLGRRTEVRRLLDEAKLLYRGVHPDEKSYRASWHYLYAQLLLQMALPNAAYEDIREAQSIEDELGERTYGVALVTGQVLNQLGRTEEAIAAFEEALKLAEPADQPYVYHELGVALLDWDRPLDAKERLEPLLTPESEYPYQAEVLADLAECEYRLGRIEEAQRLAQQGLEQGAVVAASIVLGSIALEYYHLDEALEHFERVVREASPMSSEWVIGHQMAADIMAQQGFPHPEAAYSHAQQALEHTPQSDDWHLTLQEHLSKAGELLMQHKRTLN